MKKILISSFFFAACFMFSGNIFAHNPSFSCVVTVNYQNQKADYKASSSSKLSAVGMAVEQACLSTCSSKDIHGNCPQDCLKNGVFSNVGCYRADSNKLKQIDSLPEPTPVDKEMVSKAVNSLIASTPNADTPSAKIVQQETPLLFTKWIGNTNKKPQKHPLIIDTTKKQKKLLLTPPRKKAALHL